MAPCSFNSLAGWPGLQGSPLHLARVLPTITAYLFAGLWILPETGEGKRDLSHSGC